MPPLRGFQEGGASVFQGLTPLAKTRRATSPRIKESAKTIPSKVGVLSYNR